MNKLLLLIFSVACLSGLYPISSISASPASSVEVPCSAIDAFGGGSLYLTGVEVRTSSNNNNLQLICKGTTDPPGKEIDWNADNLAKTSTPCTNYDGTMSTYDWHETISVSGQVTFICHFKD